MKNILVTIDFEEKIEPLVDKAFELAKVFDSKVWLLHIVAPNPDFVGYEAGPQVVRDRRAEVIKEEHKMIQDFALEFKEKGVDADALMVQGATIETIIDESQKLDIDLIIAGHHERGFFYNAFVGSVSAQIIKKSKIPVLIVPNE